jgi:tRNA(adenine34) deaminase
MENDEEFMGRCMELGEIARSKGDAAVGSLIILRGEIIAEGIEAVRTKNDPTAHAEIEAVRSALVTNLTYIFDGFHLRFSNTIFSG